MNEINLAIVTGIVSSILSTFFIWIFYSISRKVIVPWYEALIYKGVDLSGTWKNQVEFSNDRKAEGTLSLQQNGAKIKGEMVVKNIRADEDFTIIYKVEGHIQNNRIILNSTPRNRKNFGITSSMFNITEGGRKMIGAFVGIDNFTSDIFTFENIVWTREIN